MNKKNSKITDINKLIYRVLKNKKLFGIFMSYYNPLNDKHIPGINRRLNEEYNFIINGLEIHTDRVSTHLSDMLRVSYLILRETKKGPSMEPKHPSHRDISIEEIMIYLCGHYFNENKNGYKVKLSQIKFETIFGLIFLAIGLTLLSTAIYVFAGYLVLLLYLTFVYGISVLANVYLVKK